MMRHEAASGVGMGHGDPAANVAPAEEEDAVYERIDGRSNTTPYSSAEEDVSKSASTDASGVMIKRAVPIEESDCDESYFTPPQIVRSSAPVPNHGALDKEHAGAMDKRVDTTSLEEGKHMSTMLERMLSTHARVTEENHNLKQEVTGLRALLESTFLGSRGRNAVSNSPTSLPGVSTLTSSSSSKQSGDEKKEDAEWQWDEDTDDASSSRLAASSAAKEQPHHQTRSDARSEGSSHQRQPQQEQEQQEQEQEQEQVSGNVSNEEVEKMRSALHALTNLTGKQEETILALCGKVDRLQSTLTDSERQVSKLERQCHKAQKKAEKMSAKLAQQKQTKWAAAKEASHSQDEMKQLRDNLKKKTERVTVLEAERAEVRRRIRVLQKYARRAHTVRQIHKLSDEPPPTMVQPLPKQLQILRSVAESGDGDTHVSMATTVETATSAGTAGSGCGNKQSKGVAAAANNNNNNENENTSQGPSLTQMMDFDQELVQKFKKQDRAVQQHEQISADLRAQLRQKIERIVVLECLLELSREDVEELRLVRQSSAPSISHQKSAARRSSSPSPPTFAPDSVVDEQHTYFSEEEEEEEDEEQAGEEEEEDEEERVKKEVHSTPRSRTPKRTTTLVEPTTPAKTTVSAVTADAPMPKRTAGNPATPNFHTPTPPASVKTARTRNTDTVTDFDPFADDDDDETEDDEEESESESEEEKAMAKGSPSSF